MGYAGDDGVGDRWSEMFLERSIGLETNCYKFDHSHVYTK